VGKNIFKTLLKKIMSNLISSPYIDYIQEQKKQKEQIRKEKQKINVFNICCYEIESYSTRLRLKNSIYQTLIKNDGKIINKKLLEEINKDINLLFPYDEYGYVAYHDKPEKIFDDNRIYVYTHKKMNKKIIQIDKFEADVILQESAARRNTETISKCIKIDKEEIFKHNDESINILLRNLEYWKKLRSAANEIQYQCDEIKSKTKILEDKLENEFTIRSNSIMELIKDNSRIHDSCIDYIKHNCSH
tara:strand:+ start:92 stop:829 length:738 start_codon:yes stop_codon:yes gene_type:complete